MFKKKELTKIALLIAIFLIFELISVAGFFWPAINQSAFFVIALLVILLSFYKLEYGLLIVLAELVIGSKGYLFYLPLTDNPDGRLLSIRIVAWVLFMLVFFLRFIFQLYKEKSNAKYWQNLKNFLFIRPYIFLGATVLLGLISAIAYGNEWGNIFNDFNAWLYFLLLIPLAALRPKREQIIQIFIAGSVWLSLKTLILLAVFSYNMGIAPSVYSWLRRTLVGEMTALGGWNRVFIQSQIFPIIAYFFLLFKLQTKSRLENLRRADFWGALVLLGLFFSTLIISFSRSFWVGFAATSLVVFIFIVIQYSWRLALRYLAIFLASALVSALMILAVIPLGAPAQLEEQFTERVSNKNEAAAASRWALLPAVISEIKVNPLSGQGFGATVTYLSQDPRVLEREETGRYTTYAFEWGYLDIWLKTGIIGLVAYLWLLYSILRAAYFSGRNNQDYFYYSLATGLLFLIFVHAFTPYLNHPLGIGFVLVASCLIYKDRVY